MLNDIKNLIGSIETMQAMVRGAQLNKSVDDNQESIGRQQTQIKTHRDELVLKLEEFKKKRTALEGGVTINKNIVKSVLFQDFNGVNISRLRKLGAFRVFFLLNIIGDPKTYLGSFDKNNKLVAFTHETNTLPLLGEWKHNKKIALDMLRIGGAFLDVTVEEKTSYKDVDGSEIYSAKSKDEILDSWVKNGRAAVDAQKMTAKLFKENSL